MLGRKHQAATNRPTLKFYTTTKTHSNMVAKSKEPSEADIISNRINVRHADKLRLIASWLPAPTAEELSSAKSQEELEQEEKEMFAPVPELLVLSDTLV
jgi:hypothetical protein